MKNKVLKTSIKAWMLLLPSIIILLMFTIFPILNTIYISFQKWNLSVATPEFIGLENYSQLLGDNVFWKVLKNTLFVSAIAVPLSIMIGMLLAIALNGKLHGENWLRTFFFYPAVIPMIAIANIWLFIYTPDYGLFARFLGNFGIYGTDLLGNGSTVLIAIIIMIVWKEAGYLMIFYLAGLQNISEELYEAAKLDGASKLHILFHITMPLLMPTTLFVSILAITNSIKLVDHLVIMTGGGPNNGSNVLLYHIYETAFNFWNQGRAGALTVVLLFIMLFIAGVQFYFTDSKIHYS